MRCPVCNYEFSDGRKFCPLCGTPCAASQPNTAKKQETEAKEIDLRAKQEAALKAQQAAALKAKQEIANLKVKQEALRVQQEAQKKNSEKLTLSYREEAAQTFARAQARMAKKNSDGANNQENSKPDYFKIAAEKELSAKTDAIVAEKTRKLNQLFEQRAVQVSNPAPIQEDPESLKWNPFLEKPEEPKENFNWTAIDLPKPKNITETTSAWNFSSEPKKQKETPMDWGKQTASNKSSITWNLVPKAEEKKEIEKPAAKPVEKPKEIPAENFSFSYTYKADDSHFVPSDWKTPTFSKPILTPEEKAILEAKKKENAEIAKSNRPWEEVLKKKRAEDERKKIEEQEKEEARRAMEEKLQQEEILRKAAEERAREEEALRKAAEEKAKEEISLRKEAEKRAIMETKFRKATADRIRKDSFKNSAEKASEDAMPAIGFTAGGFVDPATIEPKILRKTPYVQPITADPDSEFNWSISSYEEKLISYAPKQKETQEIPIPVQIPQAVLPEVPKEIKEEPKVTTDTNAFLPAVNGNDIPADDEWLKQIVNNNGNFTTTADTSFDIPKNSKDFFAEDGTYSSKDVNAILTSISKETKKEEQKPAVTGAAHFQKLLNMEVDRIRQNVSVEIPDNRAPLPDDKTQIFKHFDIDASDINLDIEAKAPEVSKPSEVSKPEETSQPVEVSKPIEETPKEEKAPVSLEKPELKTNFVEISSAMGEVAFHRNTVETKMQEMIAAEEAEKAHRKAFQEKIDNYAKVREAFINDNTTLTQKNNQKKIYDDLDDEKTHHPVALTILIIILILGLFKGTKSAFNHFKPEANITSTLNQIDESFTNARQSFFSSLGKGIKNLAKKVKNEEIEEETKATVENSNTSKEIELPAMNEGIDMNAIIAENNKNVSTVVLDPTLVYSSAKNSSFSDLASCTVSDDADLKSKIYGIMIAYNSAWNDYVNYSDDKVFEYMKADGDAYTRAKNYNTATESNQKFNVLSLGEIRSFSNGVYIFTKEKISITTKEDTTDYEDYMVYRLEKVGDTYKIDRYSEYK